MKKIINYLDPKVIAVTGGIGSGQSTVCNYLKDLGVDYISAWPIRDIDDKIDLDLSPNENELNKMNFRDITHPRDLDKSVQLAMELLKNEAYENRFIEKRYLSWNGNIIWADTNVMASFSLL